MSNETLARACDALKRSGADLAVLGSVANVTYVTGVEVPIPFGALPALTYGPWIAVISVSERRGVMVVPNFAAELIESDAKGFDAIGFDTLDSFELIDPRGTFQAALDRALSDMGLSRSSIVAIEENAIPVLAANCIASKGADITVIDAESAMQTARWIKTNVEIDRLRRASLLSDVAHRTLARLSQQAGLNEIDMWTGIAAAVYREAGKEIMLSGELVTGARTNVVKYPNGPKDRVTEPGDGSIMDLSGRVDGYWFDCTNTHVIGGVQPNADQIRYARASQEACEAAMSVLKPGNRARDAASAAEAAFAKRGLPMAHYAGHQIGATVNEYPRLVPYDDSIIEAGMVFSVEPGAYQGEAGDFGARSEKMVLVREDGPEILSTFDWGI